ncbi:accessory gene regulator B family protein [Romboutsia sp.]|uniref:accessory gene regulator ArgB-like protein n=1 Tax=Romboutsia sp. TaxID=1965302 RepID=UPI002B6A73FA|nr:accessory gene regulator B family protein [Romboutsia sp.]HSQ88046.1 accessory gene regulator B family protein [Romboutsia sp.]
MGGIEKISLSISDKLGDKLKKSDDEKAILNYGLFIIIHTSLAILATIFVGILTNMVIEIMVISVTAAYMKRYSGGIHSSSPLRCVITGVLFSFILSVICKYIMCNFSNNLIAIILGIGLCLSYYILYKKCPVPSKNKPLKKESTRKKLRKKSFKLINIYLIVIIMLYILNIIHGLYWAKTCMISMFLGILLQIFALAEIGNSTLKSLEKIYDFINIY